MSVAHLQESVLPSGWRKDKIFRLCNSMGSGGTPASGNPDFYDGGIPWVQTGDLNDDVLQTTSKTLSVEGVANSATRYFPPETLLMAMYGATIGKLGILKTEATVNQACCALVLRKNISLRFMFFKLLSLRAEFIAAGRGGGQQNISQDTVKQTYVVYPKLPEQNRIAAYLDASCAAIDAAVSAKRRQLDTLEALRMSIIQRAVTQGINPKVKLKSSGLDWVSEVPEHWKVQQIKRKCSLVRGQFTHRPRNDPALYDGPYPFVQTGDITAADKYIRTYSQTLNELGLSASKQFPRGTLVMSIAANIGDVAILDFEACFPDSMIGMIPATKRTWIFCTT